MYIYVTLQLPFGRDIYYYNSIPRTIPSITPIHTTIIMDIDIEKTFYGECKLCSNCHFMGEGDHICGCGHDYDTHVSSIASR